MDDAIAGPGGAVVACVAENDPSWAQRVATLLVSLRAFGGSWRDAEVRVHVVDAIDPPIWRHVEALGASCTVVARFPARFPHANKLRMFESFAADPGRVLLALDCDVAVVGDLDGGGARVAGAVAGKPADRSPIPPARWRRLLDRFGLVCPETNLEMTTSGDRVPVPYLNSGVLRVPADLVSGLTEAWIRYMALVAAAASDDPVLDRVGFFTDQLALCLALVETGLPVVPLDLGWNFPTHRLVHADALRRAGPIRIVHYHDRLQADGALLPPVAPEAAGLVAAVNERLAAYRMA